MRPDRALFQGPVVSLVLVTYAGELGVYPGHAAEIVALGNGVVRMKKLPQDGGGEEDVVVSGGYAEIQDDEVETTAQRSYLSFGAVFLNHYLKIRCFQIIPLQLCDLTIILHDEDFFHDAHPFLASLTAIPRVLSSCPFREATGRCKGHAAGPGGPRCARPSPRRSVP